MGNSENQLKKEIVFAQGLQIKRADTFLKRFAGLMFRRKPIQMEGLLITKCNEIHMFFMSFPLDVVFLNKEREVVHVAEEFQPWRVTKKIKGAVDTLELPIGTISSYGIQVGDVIRI